MKKYITFGNFNTNYKVILSSIIFTLIYNFLFGVKIGHSTESIRFLPENEFRYHNLIHDIFNYFGILIISLILLIVEEICSTSYKKNEKEVHEEKSNRKIILIHNPTKIDQINKNTFFNISIITTLWVIHEQLEKVFYICELADLDYWTCEMLILSFLSKQMFGAEIHKHQKFAIFLVLIFCSLIKFSSFIISLEINDQSILYIKKKYWIPIGIIFFLIIISLRSYANCKIKCILDYKYIPIIKLLIFYGISGIFICSIICLVSTYQNCYYDICLIENNNIFEPKKYYDNFLIYIKKISNTSSSERVLEILLTILASLINFFCVLSKVLIIKNLSPIHTISSVSIYYILAQILLLIINKIMNGHFFRVNGERGIENKIFIKYILDLSNDIFCFLSVMIYLELIEFHFCGCDYNLRKNIIQRSMYEGNPDDIENRNSNSRKSNNESLSTDRINTELSILSPNELLD